MVDEADREEWDDMLDLMNYAAQEGIQFEVVPDGNGELNVNVRSVGEVKP